MKRSKLRNQFEEFRDSWPYADIRKNQDANQKLLDLLKEIVERIEPCEHVWNKSTTPSQCSKCGATQPQ